jgi:hypothetical protein
VTWPAHPAWIVGAVKWTISPVRALVLLALTKQINSGCLWVARLAGSISGVPTLSRVDQSRNPS